jgi:hypothetical protein
MVPKTAAKWVPYVTTRYVPRTITMRVPIGQSTIIYEAGTTAVPSVTAPPPAGAILAPGGSSDSPPAENPPASGEPSDSDPTGQPQLKLNKPGEPTPADPDDQKSA